MSDENAAKPSPTASTVLRSPTRSVLADDVYQILRESLLANRIAPGARMNLDSLARELHVSNTPVRQALARLESDGLVAKEPYRGFSASRLLDSRTIAELYDYRLLIEPPTAARAAQHSHHAEFATVAALCAKDEIDALLTAGAASELGQRDIDFHLGIARLAGNNVVAENLSGILTRMRLYTVYDRHGAGELAWDEHRAILEAVQDSDARGAGEAMRKHLAGGFERMKTSA